MNFYRLKFVIVSLLLLPCIYFTNHDITIGVLLNSLLNNADWLKALPDCPNWYSYVSYLLVVLTINWCMARNFKKLPNIVEVKMDNISKIYPASENFIPTFFAYIFLGLSISNISTLLIVFFALTIICYFGDMYLYNPVFYIMRCRYYYVERKDGSKILVLTRKYLLKGNVCDFYDIREVNDHTFIDMNK